MKIDLKVKNILLYIIMSMLLITPFVSIGEVMILFAGGIESQNIVVTPLYLKAVKDLGFIMIFFFGSLLVLNIKKINQNYILYYLFVVLVICLALISKTGSVIITFAGIRWIVPLLVSGVLIRRIDSFFVSKISRILLYLFYINFGMQILQLFFMSGWYGRNSFGLALRTPGLFMIPITCSFFMLTVLYMNYCHSDRKDKLYKLMLYLVPISLYITYSASGYIVYAFILSLMCFNNKYFKLYPVAGSLTILTAFLAIGIIFPGKLSGSFFIRLGLLKDIASEASFFSPYFGAATSTGFLLRKNMNMDIELIMSDSTYGSIIANLGIIGSSVIAFLLVVWGYRAYKLSRVDVIMFTGIFMLYAATTSITESYPMNLVMAVMIAYYMPDIFKFKRFGVAKREDSAY